MIRPAAPFTLTDSACEYKRSSPDPFQAMERMANPPAVAPSVLDRLLSTSTMKIDEGLPAWIGFWTAAMVRPSGDQRGSFKEPFSNCAISADPWPSAATVQIPALDCESLVFRRTKAMRRPSGDQSPSYTSSTTLIGSPPATGILYSDVTDACVREKRIVEPSGEKRA